MKLSFSTRGWPGFSFEEMLETAMDMGFSGVEVYRSENAEATAAGAAYLAGLAVGFFESREELKTKIGVNRIFDPQADEEGRQRALDGWHRAIKACRAFSESEE